jgi:hypothetical protein
MRKTAKGWVAGALVVGFASAGIAAAADVSFMPATTVPMAGFKMVNTPTGRYYVGSGVVLGQSDLQGVTSMREGSALELTVSPSMAASLDGVLRSTERLAAFVDGTFVDAPLARVSEGRLLLSGLTKAGGEHLANVLGQVSVEEDAPTFVVVTNASNVRPGDLITADIFITNVVDLKAFQVRARATGAITGRLPVASMVISKNRSDWVFGAGNVLDAVDNTGDRMGGLIIEGAIDATDTQKYLGTFTFETPADVSDVYYVNVEVGEETLALDSDANELAYRVNAPVVVTGGLPVRDSLQPTRTEK